MNTKFEKLQRIALVGMPGAGKSTLAKQLACELSLTCVSLDAEIENSAGQKVTQIFETQGEQHFRELEEQALLNVSEDERILLDTGAGAVLCAKKRRILSESFLVVYLEVNETSLLKRLSSSHQRPLFKNKNLTEELHMMLKTRAPLYNLVADLRIDTSALSQTECLQRIVNEINFARAA